MKKILFLIHDLGQGGAEKVLVNLVNNMNPELFNITVIALFGGGVNEKYLKEHICYKTVWPQNIPGNAKWMKLFTPEWLHRFCIKDTYDIEVSYLEGPSARIISGCRNPETRLISWIHVEQHNREKFSRSFRNYEEAVTCYNRFHETVCVSEFVKNDFLSLFHYQGECRVLYNTVESDKIRLLSEEKTEEPHANEFSLIAVGTLKKSKGFDRVINVVKRLSDEDRKLQLYILGKGPEYEALTQQVKMYRLENRIKFLGYQENPYKYVAKSTLFVCSSFAEGFSTAVTEALIVGTPVCTVLVSGMKELLGENNEYGLVVENDEQALYEGIRCLYDSPELLKEYRRRAKQRGLMFETGETVRKTEEFFNH